MEAKNSPPHPNQPVVLIGNVARFKQNAIVRWLLEAGPFDLNQIAVTPFSDDDRNQFAQLIGYSVSGFGELSYADPERVAAADRVVEQMLNKKEK